MANEVAVVAAVLVDGANEAEDTSEGATVVGGVKKEPSSSVSKKSLGDNKQSVLIIKCIVNVRQDRKLIPK